MAITDDRFIQFMLGTYNDDEDITIEMMEKSIWKEGVATTRREREGRGRRSNRDDRDNREGRRDREDRGDREDRERRGEDSERARDGRVIKQGDVYKVSRIIKMNDDLFYMSSSTEDWEELYTITSFKTNYPYQVWNGITNMDRDGGIEYGTPFEIYVVDQAMSFAICAMTALMAATVALF